MKSVTTGELFPEAPHVALQRVPCVSDVIRAHGAYVGRALRYLGVEESDLDDVCQEVFLIVHRKLSGFAGRSSLRSWLYGICLLSAREHRRKRARRLEDPVETFSEGARPFAGEGVSGSHRVDDQALLLRLLDALDDDKRAVVVLYEIEGLTLKEIAEVVGCPLQTVNSRLHAARDRMRAMMDELGMGGER